MSSSPLRTPGGPTDFQQGQVWRLADSHLKIGIVGKRLVHYKQYRGISRSAPVLLSQKAALVAFLQDSGAVLLETPTPVPPLPDSPRASTRPTSPPRSKH